MRIGFFTDMYLPKTDGVVQSIETFRPLLEAMGHQVFIFAPSPGLRHKEKSDRIIRFPAVKGLFFEDYPTSVFFPPQAMRKIKSYKLDIIHFHTPGQIGLMGAYYGMRHKTPLISTYHTDLYEYVTHYPNVLPGIVALSLMTPLFTPGKLGDFRSAIASIKPERNIDKWNKKMVMSGMTLLHNYCDYVIAPSEKIRKQLTSWHTKAPIRIIPTGVDKITTDKSAISRFRKKYKLTLDHNIVLFVGRLGREKNIELLIQAFEYVAAEDPLARLLIVGPYDHREKLEQLANTQTSGSQIIFTGYIPHAKLGAVYGAADVFAFPSQTDTQGLVLHEAACAGLPIVMIDKDITEVVENGKNGYIARNTPKDFAKKIRMVFAALEVSNDMQAHSRKLAAQYTATRQANKLEHLYQNVLAAHAKANQKK